MKRRMPKPRRVAMVTKAHRCVGGPWKGSTIFIDAYCDGNTGWLEIAGQIGRYCSGKWQPMHEERAERLAA